MRFSETSLPGALIVDLEPIADERGFFARAFCRREFEARGLAGHVAQANISFNVRKGVVRGLHFQFPPASESKLVRCSRGAILDVIVDLRPESPRYLQHLTIELNEENHRAVVVPERCAHGYQVLEDHSEVIYHVSEFYTPAAESGLRYSDPWLNIPWPLPVIQVSAKDAAWPLLAEAEQTIRARMEKGSSRVAALTSPMLG